MSKHTILLNSSRTVSYNSLEVSFLLYVTFVKHYPIARMTNEEEDFYTCKLCQKDYNDPRYLPCLHTFCRDCINKDIQEYGTTSNHHYQCPLCKVIVPLPRSRSSSGKADGFPVNDLVQNMLEAHKAKTSSNYPCQPCARTNKSTTATKWCCTCNEALCDDCIGFHQSLRKTMKHRLLDMSEVKSRSMRELMADPTCFKHEDEPLQLYCEDHEDLVCQTCAATEHRRCNNVISTNDIIRVRKRDIVTLGDALQGQSKTAQFLGGNGNEATENVDHQMNNVLGEIKFVRKRIDDILERCEKNIIGEVEEIRANDKKLVGRKSDKAKAIRHATSNSGNILRLASANATDAHLIQWHEKVYKESKGYPDRLKEINRNVKSPTIRFVINNKLNAVIKEVDELGKLIVDGSGPQDTRSGRHGQVNGRSNNNRGPGPSYHEPKDHRNRRNDRSINSLDENEEYPILEKKSNTLLPVHSATSPSDTLPCWLTGIGLLTTGFLAAADRNNRKIKIFDEMFMLKYERIIQEKPFDLTAMENGNFAITLPDEKTVDIFSTASGINQSKTLKLDEKCYGVAFAKSRFAVTCPFAYPPSVVLLSEEGQLLQNVVPSDGYRDRESIFSKPMYVKWDKLGSNLFISDSKRNQVLCLSGTKFKKYFYHSTNLVTPRGLAVLADDTLYVCGWGSDNIHHVGSEGRQLGEILDRHDGVIGPQNVCLSKDKQYLIVTLDPSSVNSDNIFMFKIN